MRNGWPGWRVRGGGGRRVRPLSRVPSSSRSRGLLQTRIYSPATKRTFTTFVWRCHTHCCAHKLNMELDLLSLFGLLCTAYSAETPQLPPPPPPAFGLKYEGAILVSQDIRHLFETSWLLTSISDTRNIPYSAWRKAWRRRQASSPEPFSRRTERTYPFLQITESKNCILPSPCIPEAVCIEACNKLRKQECNPLFPLGAMRQVPRCQESRGERENCSSLPISTMGTFDTGYIKRKPEALHCKNFYRFSRHQPGCHLLNSPWPGCI